MYKDKDQLNLIDEVHAMTYDEAVAITGNRSSTTTTGMRSTGGCYWLASAISHDGLWYVRIGGDVYGNRNYCWGVRPVVSLKSGVYIEKGTGTEEDKYILKMEQ